MALEEGPVIEERDGRLGAFDHLGSDVTAQDPADDVVVLAHVVVHGTSSMSA
jgi:hypothetical protein